jgi:hypothetical protein
MVIVILRFKVLSDCWFRAGFTVEGLPDLLAPEPSPAIPRRVSRFRDFRLSVVHDDHLSLPMGRQADSRKTRP